MHFLHLSIFWLETLCDFTNQPRLTCVANCTFFFDMVKTTSAKAKANPAQPKVKSARAKARFQALADVRPLPYNASMGDGNIKCHLCPKSTKSWIALRRHLLDNHKRDVSIHDIRASFIEVKTSKSAQAERKVGDLEYNSVGVVEGDDQKFLCKVCDMSLSKASFAGHMDTYHKHIRPAVYKGWAIHSDRQCLHNSNPYCPRLLFRAKVEQYEREKQIGKFKPKLVTVDSTPSGSQSSGGPGQTVQVQGHVRQVVAPLPLPPSTIPSSACFGEGS